jgi:hypothetical protein
MGGLNMSTPRYFIGNPSESVKTAINDQIKVDRFFKKITELNQWLKLDNPSFIERAKVLVTPGGFSKNLDFREQINLIQDCMRLLPNGSELVIIFNDNAKYLDVVGEHWVTYEYSTLDQVPAPTVDDLIERLKDKPQRNFVYESDYIPKEKTQTTPVERESKPTIEKKKTLGERMLGVDKVDTSDIDNAEYWPPQPKLKNPPAPTASQKAKAKAIIGKSADGKVIDYNPPVDIYKGEDQKTVIIVSLFDGCGSTTVAMNTCSVLSDEQVSTALIEYPENQPVLYDYLNGKKNADNRWSSLISKINKGEEVTKKDYWKENNVTWLPMGYSDYGMEISPPHIDNLFKASNIAQATFIDASTNWDSPTLERWYKSCDEIWVVVKPNILKTKYALPKFKGRMAAHADKIKFIGNAFDTYSSSSKILELMEVMLSQTKESILAGKNVRSDGPNPWEGKIFSAIVSSYAAPIMSRAQWLGNLLVNTAEVSAQSRAEFGDCANVLYKGISTSFRKRMGSSRAR